MNKLAKKYAEFAMSYRRPIVVFVTLITVLFAYFIKDLDIRNDPDTLLPPSNRYVATNAYGEQKFGFGNLMVVGFIIKEGNIYQPWYVNMLKEVHHKMEALPAARPSNFMDIAAQKIKYMGTDAEGGLKFKRLIPVEGIDTQDSKKANEQLDFLKEGLENNPVLAPMLVYKEDKNGKRCVYGQENCIAKGSFIIADYDDSVKEIYLPWIKEVIKIVENTQEKYKDKVEVLIAGEPYFLAFMLHDLVKKWWLFAISFLIVIIMLAYKNKGWRGSIFPILGVSSTIIITLGLMGFTQYKLTTMMVLTPMLLLAIGTGHAVQVTRRFLHELHLEDCTPFDAAKNAIEKTIVPATLAIITDMAGFATLAFVDISFYKAYAYFGMLGMATLLFTTTTLTPILLSLSTSEALEKDNKLCKPSKLEQYIADKVSFILTNKLKWLPIIMIFALITWSTFETGILKGTKEDLMPKVEKGINYSRAAFKEKSITIQHLNRLGEVMPGVISVNIPIKGIEPLLAPCTGDEEEGAKCFDEDEMPAQGVFNNAEALTAIEKFEDWMRVHPNIGFTGSYVQYIKLVNMLLMSKVGEKSDINLFHVPNDSFISKNMDTYGDPEDKDYTPDSDYIISTFNGLLEANTSKGDLDSFVSASDWNEGIIMGFVNTMDPVKTNQTVKDIQKYLDEHKNEPGFRKIKFGYKSGDVIKMPITGDIVTVEESKDDYVAVGGFLGATQATHDIAIKEWLKSPLQTALAILLISLIIFRCYKISIILVSSLLITLYAQYGLGAYFSNIQNWSGNLHFATLVSLSIAMGLGVDYGVYMISRLREEMINSKNNWSEALHNTLSTTGSAVFASIIVLLASFIPLLNTDLANTWALGIFISEALLIDVVLALTIIPLIVYWMKPNYVFKAKE